ncbi:hypothetical protein LguiB_031972 [Lonicera macranthoides]
MQVDDIESINVCHSSRIERIEEELRSCPRGLHCKDEVDVASTSLLITLPMWRACVWATSLADRPNKAGKMEGAAQLVSNMVLPGRMTREPLMQVPFLDTKGIVPEDMLEWDQKRYLLDFLAIEHGNFLETNVAQIPHSSVQERATTIAAFYAKNAEKPHSYSHVPVQCAPAVKTATQPTSRVVNTFLRFSMPAAIVAAHSGSFSSSNGSLLGQFPGHFAVSGQVQENKGGALLQHLQHTPYNVQMPCNISSSSCTAISVDYAENCSLNCLNAAASAPPALHLTQPPTQVVNNIPGTSITTPSVTDHSSHDPSTVNARKNKQHLVPILSTKPSVSASNPTTVARNNQKSQLQPVTTATDSLADQNGVVTGVESKDSMPSNTVMALNEVFGAHSSSSYHIQSPSHKLDSPHNDSIASTSHSSKHAKANHHNTSSFEESFVPCSVSLKQQNLKTNAKAMLHITSFYTQHTSTPHNSFKNKSRFKNQFDPISDLYWDGDGDGENWDFFEESDDDIAATIAHDDDQFHAATPSNKRRSD